MVPRFDPATRRSWTTPYLPDFRLPDGTLVEVKGAEEALDRELLYDVAQAIGGEDCTGPGVLILGPIPNPPDCGDLGWLHLRHEGIRDEGEWCTHVREDRMGFGAWPSKGRLWWHCEDEPTGEGWLAPTVDPNESDVSSAYVAARSARFEHGESGAPRPRRRSNRKQERMEAERAAFLLSERASEVDPTGTASALSLRHDLITASEQEFGAVIETYGADFIGQLVGLSVPALRARRQGLEDLAAQDRLAARIPRGDMGSEIVAELDRDMGADLLAELDRMSAADPPTPPP